MITIKGKVIDGQKRGHLVGMPTANLSIENLETQIEYGVYSCYVYIDDNKYIGVCNVGNRPSVDKEILVEVHILDFDNIIYGKMIEIELVEYIRPISKFNSLDEVKKQVDKDILKTRELLKL